MRAVLRWAVTVQLCMTGLSVLIFYTISLVAAPLDPPNVRGVGVSAALGLAFGSLWAAGLLSAALLRDRVASPGGGDV